MGESNQDGDKNLISENDSITDEDLALSFVEDRHLGPLVGIDECDAQVWRMKERMKTVSVALVLCLNVGVDPPDVIKTQPCARQECWVDPTSMSSSKALEKIGHNLQAQYERWQPRARYKQSLDPTSEEVKKLCISLRKNAKEERVLFHYNGHGVPKPTSNGEIWVFNRTYTQYIPLSIYDLQTWMGSPSIYVYDCSNAGIIVESFKQFANQHKTEYELAMLQDPKPEKVPPPPMFENCIQLAACAANQALPMTPELPADLFTACLTTPIKVALRWFVLQPTSKLMPKVTLDLIDKIPGQTSDRRTMLGELNWIFTAITDTIAWNTLPRDLFQKLFRQDLLVASLFRNYLLAERIMRSCDCTPVSSPALPPTYQHPMWQAWDLALDLSLRRLPAVVADESSFTHMGFFEEQLTAFDVWLELGSETREPPVQLPIVLQVLLSQIHRLRALELLAKFLDLGPWAVNLALSVGIFPYVLKLLQSYSKEVRGLLVFIWSKILAVDNGCKSDLVRDNGHKYFLTVLQDTSVTTDQRTQATFVLSCIVHNYREGQEAALKNSLVSVCLEQLNDPCADLRQWVAICLGRLWDHYEKARWTGVRDTAHEKLYNLLKDPCPEVRAAAVYALGTFINSVAERSEHANNVDHSVAMTLVNAAGGDASPLVRKELVGALQWAVLAFETKFVGVALLRDSGGDSLERVKRVASSSAINAAGSQAVMQPPYSGSLASIGYGSMFRKVWAGLVALEADPALEVARLGGCVTRYIRDIAKRQREEADNRLNGLSISSVSLPPSPNRTNYLSGESPPTLHPAEDLKLSRSSLSSRSKKSMKTSVGDREEKDKDKDKDEKDKDKENEDDLGHRCLVRTMFIEWASRRFALNKRRNMPMDTESPAFYERDWRRTRNRNIRNEAIEEQRKALGSKIESQVFHIKTAVPPSILKLHPFDQQIAVAGQDRFAIFDWGTGAKTTAGHIASSRPTKVTALEWINSHDVAMLMVASDDGGVRLWRPNACVSREPTQVTAWQAFSDVKNRNPGVVMTWEQWTQTLITCGDSRNIRFWDVERELRAMDLPTGTDKATTCIDSTFSSICHENHKKNYDFVDLNDDGFISDSIQLYHGPKLGMCAIGCADGSVRLFDRRCSPNEARVRVWMEHPSSVLSIQLRDNLIVSGSSAGDVRIYDIRKNDSIHTTQAVQNSGMSCLAIHRSANIYACGSVNQFINVYKLKGTLLNSIRMYEGFMSHRIGPVACLDFHPLRAALAAGTADCCIDVYAPEGGGRR